MGHSQPLEVLILEDDPRDAELMLRALLRSGFEPHVRQVATEEAYLDALDGALDIILADFNVPGFGAQAALTLLRERSLDVPFIVVSGSIGEETAVDLMKRGATDYLMKDRIVRLGEAVRHAVASRRAHRARKDAERAQARAEARMRFALRASQIGIWEVDLRRGTAEASEIFERAHGLAPGSFPGTLDAFVECVFQDDREMLRDALTRAATADSDADITYRTIWPDGALHWIHLIGRRPEGDDHAMRATGVVLDITAQRALEDRYRQAQKMEAVGQLAGGIAHDFNNLLTVIHGYCESLLERLGEDAEVEQILLSAERAADLTRQLLAFSRRQVLQPRVFDLGDSIRSVEPMLRRLLGSHITIVVDRLATGRVKADPGQLELVLLNLAVNARDAMPNGGRIHISIRDVTVDDALARLHAGASAGPHVAMSVTDSGTGIEPAVLERIFEPFFTTKEPGRGTGLGLATVYGIAKQSGGFVVVDSKVGSGTTFTVYLPRVDAPVEIVAKQERRSRSLNGSETVLLMEDEDEVAALLARVLQRHGYQVLLATKPDDALALANTHAIDLLICDVVLPQLSGPRLAARLTAARPDLRVLFMSGYADDAVGAEGAGVPFLQKPFTPQVLARKVRDLLDEDGPPVPLRRQGDVA